MADGNLDQPEIEVASPETIGEAMGESENAAVMGVDVDVVAVLGTAELKVSQILQLGRGAVVELDHGAEDHIDLLADGRLVARGQVVVVGEMLAVEITEVFK